MARHHRNQHWIFIKWGCISQRREKEFNAKTAFRENVSRIHLAIIIRECILFSYFLVRYWTIHRVGEYDRMNEPFNLLTDTYVKLTQLKKERAFTRYRKDIFLCNLKTFSQMSPLWFSSNHNDIKGKRLKSNCIKSIHTSLHIKIIYVPIFYFR